MPVVANHRVIPEAIRETYNGLRPLFDEY
jgi:hypothetical protein